LNFKLPNIKHKPNETINSTIFTNISFLFFFYLHLSLPSFSFLFPFYFQIIIFLNSTCFTTLNTNTRVPLWGAHLYFYLFHYLASLIPYIQEQRKPNIIQRFSKKFSQYYHNLIYLFTPFFIQIWALQILPPLTEISSSRLVRRI
jgi:hypothetical protein